MSKMAKQTVPQSSTTVNVQTTCTHCSTPTNITVDFSSVRADTQVYYDGVTTTVYYVDYTCPSCNVSTDVRVGGFHYNE